MATIHSLPRPRRTRDDVVSAAERLIDRDGWDGLTMSALAAELDLKGPSLYKHVASLDDLRREIRLRAMRDLAEELRTAALGRVGTPALLALARAYRDWARRHPGRYAAHTRLPVRRSDVDYHRAGLHAAEAVLAVLHSYGLDADAAYRALQEVWAAVHGFLSLELSGAMAGDLDRDELFDEMVSRLAASMQTRGTDTA